MVFGLVPDSVSTGFKGMDEPESIDSGPTFNIKGVISFL